MPFEATEKTFVDEEAFRFLPLRKGADEWQLTLHRIEESKRVVGVFRCDCVPVLRLSATHLSAWVWPPGKRSVTGHRARGSGGSAGEVGHDLGGEAAIVDEGAHPAGEAVGHVVDDLDIDQADNEENDAGGDEDGLALLLHAMNELHDVEPDGLPLGGDDALHGEGGEDGRTPTGGIGGGGSGAVTPSAAPVADDGGGEGLPIPPEPEPVIREAVMPEVDVAPPLVPPPAPPPPDLDPALAHLKSGYDAYIVCEGGVIVHYPALSAFVATCNNPDHGRCIMQRASGWNKTEQQLRRMRGGRPLGFLTAWLQCGCWTGNKEHHWAYDELPLMQAVRSEIREDFLKATADGQALMRKERPRRAGEPEEPPTLDGYL